MNKLSEKQLLIVTIGVAVLLTGGLGFLIWRDLEAIDEEREKTAALEQQIQAANREIEQIPAREYRVIANREISEKETAYLPEETEIETFWEVLERFADESGVRISKIAQGGSRAAGGRRGRSSISSVEQVIRLRADTDEFLRFINAIENYDRIINVVEFQITAGDRPDRDGKVRHKITLALRTFTYSKKIANTIVSIPQYEKKKAHAEVKKWLSNIKVEEKATYALRTPIDRRDPFLNVRREPEKKDPGEGEADRAYQEQILENLVDNIRTLQEGLKIEEHLRSINDLWRLGIQMKENRELFNKVALIIEDVERKTLITLPELAERFQKEVLEPFAEIRRKMDLGAGERPPLTREQVEEYYDRVAEAFDDRDWKRLREEVRNFKNVSDNGENVAEGAQDLAIAIAEFEHRARIIQEFEKRNVEITTILYSPGGGNSIAVINGKQTQEGDALDGDGRVIVIEIGENFVIFQTEGVDIKRMQSK